MTMTNELKAKWVAALRSGEYKQTTEALRDDNGHCCLGVLCDISGMGRWGNPTLENKEDSEFYYLPGYESADVADGISLSGVGAGYLPEQMNEMVSYSFQQQVAGMNDEGMTFIEIADFIESNL